MMKLFLLWALLLLPVGPAAAQELSLIHILMLVSVPQSYINDHFIQLDKV